MEKKPLFSILMPAYNAGRFIHEAIECIIRQTFTDWELVVVDDCSTDSTAEIAERSASRDGRITVNRRMSNSGTAYLPRVEAARIASGKYVIPIDADDFVDSSLLEKLAGRIASTEADIVIPEMWRFSEGHPHRILPLPEIDTEKAWRGSELLDLTMCVWKIPMAGFAVRRDIYLRGASEITPYDMTSIFADELLSRWILSYCNVGAFCDARYHYRHNPDSVTQNPVRHIEGSLITSEGLVAMAERRYGRLSEHHLMALRHKFLRLVDALRGINIHHPAPENIRNLEKMVAASLSTLDLSLLRGRMSPRYLALMRLPVGLARLSLRIIDRVIRTNGE